VSPFRLAGRAGTFLPGRFLLSSGFHFALVPEPQTVQGASPSYAPAAREAIRCVGIGDPARLWRMFCDLVPGPTNPKLNPLYHHRGACDCVSCVLAAGRGFNVITDSRRLLERNEVDAAHSTLHAIRGVGPKIASFFLRDVALHYGLEPAEDRHLLQPIDLWVRRFARMLDRSLDGKPDPVVARWIVDRSQRPELANAGLWYFGARIAPQKHAYERALGDVAEARRLAERYVDRLERAVAAWRIER
jgi:hypothetical protein